MPAVSIRALLADDNDVLLAALRDSLGDAPDIEVVATASTGDQTLEHARAHAPDVAVLDIGMPGGGAELVQQVCRLDPAPRVLVFSGRDDADTVMSMIAAGATGFVAKGSLGEEFHVCVRRAAAGRFFVVADCADEVRARFIDSWAGR